MTKITQKLLNGLSRVAISLTLVSMLASLAFSACALKPERSLVLATTTSTYDSGLLEFILPAFEDQHNTKVKVIAVGTGQALALAARGDADVVLVHAPDLEEEFVQKGFGVQRTFIMYNDFVILGASNDPANINSSPNATDAFGRIASTQSTFVSRGDESGTHIKERIIWALAGIESPETDNWYLSLGQGMGASLNVANEKHAYILSDRGTFLSRGASNLAMLTEGDPILFNPYHFIIVNPDKFHNVQMELGQLLLEFLISAQTQEKISSFGVDRFGQTLFNPASSDLSAK